MKCLTIDTETTCLKLDTKKLNGNPYSRKNFLCYVGLRTHDGEYLDFDIEYSDNPYGEQLRKIQEIINGHDCIIGFNLKFDLHWLSRYGIVLNAETRVFDAQLAYYIIRNQSTPFPALHDCAISYGFEGKLDVVKEQYWKRGIDTENVPEHILREYLKQDVEQTYKVFSHQLEIIPESKKRLISLSNQDLLVLLEMEKNGMIFDEEESLKEGERIQQEIDKIDGELLNCVGFRDFNPGSNDHISAVLYGGSINTRVRKPYTFHYKDGRTAEKLRWEIETTSFPRLVQPLKGSELKKEGFFSTNEDTLNSLRAVGKAKRIIKLILQRAKLDKLNGTYLKGLPALVKEMDWEPGIIHGQLNQCTAVTGRLSSSKPNLQNIDKTIQYLFKSAYKE